MTNLTMEDATETRGLPKRRRGPAGATLWASAAYLIVSLVVWWNVWSSHPTTTTTCGCGDSSEFTWYLGWPAHAISHGLNPLYSADLFHPVGINLLSNTSVLALGVPLAPVTWAFGPVATLNVALTLAPVLSALAMFWLLRRWVSWAPAAWIGGLLYGFSPFVLVELTDAHLMLGMAVVPPLLVGTLDELLIRQERKPVRVGLTLAALLVLQFFLGTELLVITVMMTAIGVLVLLVAGLWRRDVLADRARYVATGLGAGAGATVVLLAYPAWFALAGPAHLQGSVWTQGYLGLGGIDFRSYFLGDAASAGYARLARRVGGYQGPTLSGQYLGVGLVAVVAAGLLLWWRDRKMWLFAIVGAVSVWFSIDILQTYWVPSKVLVRVPLVQNIIPSRFLAVTYLCVAVLLGLVVDHVYRAILGGRWSLGPGESGPGESGRSALGQVVPGSRELLSALVAGVVALLAVTPVISYEAQNTPMTAQGVVVPKWFTEVGSRLGPGHVVVTVPVPIGLIQSALTWQAVTGFPFAMVGGGGPEGLISRAGREAPGQAALVATSFSFSPVTTTPATIDHLRSALDEWGVTDVVIPDPTGTPLYQHPGSVPLAVGVLTAALGRGPRWQADAWVWNNVKVSPAPLELPPGQVAACAGTTGTELRSEVSATVTCVLKAGRGTRS